jgi:hypothetical protein
MIQTAQIMPLVLSRCPGFKSTWDKHRELWQGEEAGIYNDLGEFASFIVDAYARQEIVPIAAAFALVEELLDGGDEEVRAAAAFGFLEDLKNTASWRPFGALCLFNGSDLNQKRRGPKLTKSGEAKQTLRKLYAQK